LGDQLRTIIHTNTHWFASPIEHLFQDFHHTLGRKRSIHFNPKCFPIKVIDHIQGPKGSAIGKSITHKIQGPSLVSLFRYYQSLANSSWQALFRFSFEMQRHRSVYPADALVVPNMSLVAQIIGHFVTAPARLLVCQLAQLLRNGFICAPGFLVAIHTTTELDCATG
jgi:hypothetical protein